MTQKTPTENHWENLINKMQKSQKKYKKNEVQNFI